MLKERRNRTVTALIATVMCCVLLLSGTLAWTSFSQTATNEIMGDGLKNPGGRLHDDFNGNDGIKKIYVENFSSGLDGTQIIVRVRLREYMELGADAGDKTNRNDVKILSNSGNARIDDPTTWDIYKYGESDHYGYWKWTEGGDTAYMPTFNMNKDSKAADINGSYAGTGEGGTPGQPFSDYHEYVYDPNGTDTTSKTANEIKDADDNDTDEGESAVEGTNITTVANQEHFAKMSENAEVISMEEWKTTKNSEMGNYWVYDTDGWAYWANPLKEKTATGLLLKGIEKLSIPKKWYYAIYVEGQMVDVDGIGSPAGGENDPASGLYSELAGGAPSADAQTLLAKLKEDIKSKENIIEEENQSLDAQMLAEVRSVYEATLEAEAALLEEEKAAKEEETVTDTDLTEDTQTGEDTEAEPEEEVTAPDEAQTPEPEESETTKDQQPAEDTEEPQTPEETSEEETQTKEPQTEEPEQSKKGGLSTLFGLYSMGVN